VVWQTQSIVHNLAQTKKKPINNTSPTFVMNHASSSVNKRKRDFAITLQWRRNWLKFCQTKWPVPFNISYKFAENVTIEKVRVYNRFAPGFGWNASFWSPAILVSWLSQPNSNVRDLSAAIKTWCSNYFWYVIVTEKLTFPVFTSSLPCTSLTRVASQFTVSL